MNLFTGITGTIGKCLQARLLDHVTPSRVIARDPAKLELTKDHVEVVEGAFENESLDRALSNVQKALLLMANGPEQKELECRFIDRAKAAGVAHIVKVSAVGADADSRAQLKRIHGEVEDYLIRSGVTYTIVRPNFFMQNLFNVAGSIRDQSQFYMPMGEGEVGMVDAADVAEMVLAIMASDAHANQVYELSGPELLSFKQIAEILTHVLGREIKYIDIPIQSFKEAMLGAGVGPWYVDAVADLFALTKLGSSAFLSPSFEAVVGRRPTLLSEFVDANRHVFSSN